MDQQEQDQQDGGQTADEVARKLSNPTANIGKLNFNYDHVIYDGDLPGAAGGLAMSSAMTPSNSR